MPDHRPVAQSDKWKQSEAKNGCGGHTIVKLFTTVAFATFEPLELKF